MIRYRKTYRCVVEGQQEQLYLKHLGKLLSRFPDIVVTFNTSIGNAYELTKSYEEYDKACLFDFDFNEREFVDNLSICAKLNNQRKKQKYKVYHAYSNVCFDLWLLLHKTEYFRSVTSNNAYIRDVIKAYELPDEADIKNEKIINTMLNEITLDDVKTAILNAKTIRSRKLPVDVHRINNIEYYDNPDFSLDAFIEMVINDVPK